MNVSRPHRSFSIRSRGGISHDLLLAAGSCLAALVLLASPVKAQSGAIQDGYQIDLDKVVNGQSPAGSGPWMSLRITNIPAPGGGVSIWLDPNLAAGEFVTKLGLNLTNASSNPIPNPFAGLSVACVEETAGATICSNYNYVAQVNGYNIEGAAVAGFDLGFNFTGTGQNGGRGRLTGDKTVRFNLTGTTLSAADLLGTIVVQGFDVNAAAKVQGISGGGSGVVGDPPTNGAPVPGPLPILGAAAAFQASRRLRRRLGPVAVAAARSA